MESIRKLSNFNFQRTKTLHQKNFKYIASFFTLFKGYSCNKLYQITPKKRFLWEPEKKIHFKSFKFHDMKFYAWWFYLCFLNPVKLEIYFLMLPEEIVFGVITDN